MPAIKLSGFRGEQPRIIPRQLPNAGAQVAQNCRLDDGGLTPIRQSVQIDDAGGVGHQTIYKFGSDWLSWAGVVDAAPGPVDDTRLYYTGDGVPKMLVAGATYDLKLPLPATASATLGGAGTGDVVTRAYVWTWVTGFGEESEPSASSNLIDWQPGNTVTISGFTAAPAGRNITKQRIYRTQTGQSGTYFYLIAERAASNSNFSDTVPVDAFAEPLPSEDWSAPDDDMIGLVAMANGMMAGFFDRTVCFCEPFRPHAWPEKYQFTVDSDIVALAAIGTTLFILTEANPHWASGSSPDAMQPNKIEINLPCIARRSVANMGFCVAYASNEGLVRLNSNGGAGYVSVPLFGRDDWLKLSPSTIVGSQHQGRYVAFYDADLGGELRQGAYIIDVGDQPFLTRTSARALAAFFDVESGALCYLPPGTIHIVRFDDPSGARQQQYWKSKPFILPYPETFGVIRIDADQTLSGDDEAAFEAYEASIIAANQALLDLGPIEGEINAAPVNEHAVAGDTLAPLPVPPNSLSVGIWADNVLVATIVVTNRPRRLPAGFTAEKWEIDVSGDVPVTQIVVAKTMEELGQVA